MTYKLLNFIWFFILVFINSVTAQDPYFSQFYANRVYLNPAYAGFDPGTTVTINYRDQWFGIPDGDVAATGGSFRTYNVTADLQAPCFMQMEDVNMGVSLSAFRDEAGGMPLVTQGFGLAISHEQPFWRGSNRSKLRRLDIRAGVQMSMMQKSLNGDYFIYSDQLDPVIGLITDPSILRLQSRLFPNLNAGVMLRGYHKKSKDHNTLFTVGLNFANVNEPNESLRDAAAAARLPMRATLHAGFTYQVTRYSGTKSPVFLAPQFRWDRQANSKLNLQTLGAYMFSKGFYTGLFVQYNFPNAPQTVTSPLGNSFLTRNTTTLIFNTGVDIRSVFDWGVPWRKRDTGVLLGLSYDINVAGLTSDNTLGALEISLRMNFKKERPKDCVEIGKFELYRGDCPVRF